METDRESVTAPGSGALPSSPVTCPLEQTAMQYSSWAGETSIQPNRQDLPKRCLPFFPSQPAPRQQIRVCQTLLWLWKHDMRGASSPTLPLAQRANVPLKMHIFAAHLMHMHHTLGTKWNDISSDTEYPSSDIQFTFLQWAWGVGGISPCASWVWTFGKCETEKALVERHPSGCCWDSHLLNAADSFSSSTQNVEISWDENAVRVEKHDATQEIHRVTGNLRTDTGPGITADVNCWK